MKLRNTQRGRLYQPGEGVLISGRCFTPAGKRQAIGDLLYRQLLWEVHVYILIKRAVIGLHECKTLLDSPARTCRSKINLSPFGQLPETIA